MTSDDKPRQPWPADWTARRNDADRILSTFVKITGQAANGYLSTRAQIPGYSRVNWRDGHVYEPADLGPADAHRFLADLLTVGCVLDQVLTAKVNYEILGNTVPHLHAHVVPRPQVDPTPCGALPWTFVDDHRPDPRTVRELADQLRRRLAGRAEVAAAEPGR